MIEGKIFIYGKHAVKEALEYKENILQKVHFATYFDESDILKEVKRRNLPTSSFTSVKGFKGVTDESTHQGVIAELQLSKLVKPYKEFMSDFEVTPDTCFVILGELSDPQNAGAIIRSAGAFGVSAVLISENSKTPLTGTVIKVSAGMAFKVPIVSISNINSTAEDLKKRGFWIYGLEGESKTNIDKEVFEKPTVFILGNESAGIKEKTKDVCDILLRIPMNPRCESLNVASSASVALYEWSKNHRGAMKI